MSEIERRTLPGTVEFRAGDDETGTLEGLGIVFGSRTDLGPFTEEIAPSAVEGVMDDDVRSLVNHDPNMLIGRTKSGTLRLKVADEGVRYEVDLPDTTVGRDTRELVRRGDISGSSFAFTVEGEEWRDKESAKPHRIITRLGKLFDVSPVVFPAYKDTEVSARALDHVKELREATETSGQVDGEVVTEEPVMVVVVDKDAHRRRIVEAIEALDATEDDVAE